MLDFGTDIDPQEDFERDGDDLFGEPAAAEPATVNVSRKVIDEPRRIPVKPPVLPKYDQPPKPEKEHILPVLKNNPHFLHRKRKSEEFSNEDKMEVSRILKAARSSSGLSLDDVEKATQIRTHYVQALENADYDVLPRPVYVLAYLRKLCELYDIPEEEENQLVRPWRDIHCELPENLTASVQQDSENPHGKVLHQIEVAILAVGALVILGIVVGIVVLVLSYINEKEIPALTVDNTRLLELQEKPQLQIPGEH